MGLGALPVAVLDRFPSLQATSRAAAVVASGIPYLPVPVAALCGAMAVDSRSRGRRALWSAACGVAVAVGARRWLARGARGPSPDATDLVVLSANVLYGLADPRQVAELARRADLIAVQENTPAFADALSALVGDDFPHRVGTAKPGARGTMLWSRTPLDLVGSGETDFSSVVARTTVRGVPWTVANVHPVSPMRGSGLWESDAAAVLDLVSPHVGDHLVVVGDFNAVEEHLTMRRLSAAGLTNAMRGWRALGAPAWQPSWPTDKRFVPPLIRIDHALHSDSVEAWRPTYVAVPGSDHKALVATFRAR